MPGKLRRQDVRGAVGLALQPAGQYRGRLLVSCRYRRSASPHRPTRGSPRLQC
jgi:hypothetical protein